MKRQQVHRRDCIFFPILVTVENFYPFFILFVQMGSLFVQMGSLFAKNLTRNPCILLCLHTPLSAILRAYPPTPPNNTSFQKPASPPCPPASPCSRSQASCLALENVVQVVPVHLQSARARAGSLMQRCASGSVNTTAA